MPTTRPDPLVRALPRFPLALKRDALSTLMHRVHDDEMENGAPTQPTADDTAGGILIIPIRGMIVPRMADVGECWCMVTPMDWLMDALDRAKADPTVRGVVLDISSPGGISWLVPEAAAKIRELALVKPVRAVANAQAASAAYWLMTAAGKRFVTPSGEVGSVGVWCMHVDQSKMLEEWGVDVTLIFAGEHKVDGNPFEPLSDDAKADLQKGVDDCYAMFTGDVAKYMGVTLEKVLADFGQGRCLMAADALAAGMVDGVATLQEVIAGMQVELAADPEPRHADEGVERRGFESGETRAQPVIGNETGVLFGTALRYHSPSSDLGGFREVFEPGAFAASIAEDDIRVIWQHDPKYIFGRVKAGTATIREDREGLHYTAEPPDAQWAKDAMASIRRGDVTQNSFAFVIAEPRKDNERWERRTDGLYRVIRRARLLEVGPQTHPAYEDTSVAVRSMQAALAESAVVEIVEAPKAPSVDALRDRMKVLEATL